MLTDKEKLEQIDKFLLALIAKDPESDYDIAGLTYLAMELADKSYNIIKHDLEWDKKHDLEWKYRMLNKE